MKGSSQRHLVRGTLVLTVAFVGACSLVGCGNRDSNPPAGATAQIGSSSGSSSPSEAVAEATATPMPDVALDVRQPSNSVRKPSVRVSGKATRGATVKVHGRRVTVNRGRFGRTVPLQRGQNTIVVRASKRGMNPTQIKFSVTRKLTSAELAAIAARKQAAIVARIANFKNNATTIPYNQLNKNSDRYKGKRVKYTGQILQIQEETGSGGFMLLSVTDLGYGIYDDNIWVDYDKSIRSAEEDVVTVYGTITGSKSYETQIGGETYVPRMRMRYIDE